MWFIAGITLLFSSLFALTHYLSPDKDVLTVWYKDRIKSYEHLLELSSRMPELFSGDEVRQNREQISHWEKQFDRAIKAIRMRKIYILIAMIAVDGIFLACYLSTL